MSHSHELTHEHQGGGVLKTISVILGIVLVMILIIYLMQLWHASLLDSEPNIPFNQKYSSFLGMIFGTLGLIIKFLLYWGIFLITGFFYFLWHYPIATIIITAVIIMSFIGRGGGGHSSGGSRSSSKSSGSHGSGSHGGGGGGKKGGH